jgi:hypothetical protein
MAHKRPVMLLASSYGKRTLQWIIKTYAKAISGSYRSILES